MTEVYEIVLGHTEGDVRNASFAIIFCRDYTSEGLPAFLVLERRDETFGIPGGLMEMVGDNIESFVATIAREVFEETSYQINETELEKLTLCCSHGFVSKNGPIHTHATALEVDRETFQKIHDGIPQAMHFLRPGTNDATWEIKGSKIIPIDAQHTDSDLYKFMASNLAPSMHEQLLVIFELCGLATTLQINSLKFPGSMDSRPAYKKNLIGLCAGCELGS